MAVHTDSYLQIAKPLAQKDIVLVAVSKTKPVSEIKQLYDLGHRDFGENYVQEMVEKQAELPLDIRWHFIGHLQTNKVKQIAPFVHLIHGSDSLKLLKEIDKQGQKNNRVIDTLLQVHIAREETKFGVDENELREILTATELKDYSHMRIAGFMGMASFTDDMAIVRNEFRHLKSLFEQYRTKQIPNTSLQYLSMGMSADYTIAIEEGSNMLRIGSLLFGARN